MKLFITIFLLVTSILLAQKDVSIRLTNEQYKNAKISYNFISEDKVRVNISDEFGEPIKDLSIRDFEITIDGYKNDVIKVVPLSQAVDASLRLFLCLDNSASMGPYVDDMLTILDTLMNSLPKSSNINLLTFSNDKFGIIPYKENIKLKINQKNYFAQNRSAREEYYKRYKNDLTDKTYLYDMVYTAFNTAGKENNNPNELFYIIFSDGGDIGSETNSSIAINSYKNGKVFFINFGRSTNSSLESLSKISQGKIYNAENVFELANVFRQIGEKIIFSGYELTLESRNPGQIIPKSISMFKNNQKINISKLKIEEFKVREIFPLLNYVFFDKNSSELNSKYIKLKKEDINSFDEKKLPAGQMNIYFNVLNIIASRLLKNPSANVSLIGCNDNSESELNNKALSQERAEAVKKYLTEIWSINEDRIKIQTRNLPLNPSNNKIEEGKAENRRVEILADDPNILDLVEVTTYSKISDPEIISIDLTKEKKLKIKSYTLMIKQKDNIIYSENFNQDLPEVIQWNITPALVGKTIDNNDFNFIISAIDEKNRELIPGNLRIQVDYISKEMKQAEKTTDKYIEKVSLVLFDFNSSALNSRNEFALMKLNESIKSNSKVIVNGYTDNIGSKNFNLKLSSERAKMTLQKIKSLLKPETKDLSSFGIGMEAPLYSNNFPEGRFYNRTCQIIIETPLEQ